MSDDKQKQFAKAAFASVYGENPAEFNRIAQEAIKDRVREKIKEIRGEIRDSVTDKFLNQDSKDEQ